MHHFFKALLLLLILSSSWHVLEAQSCTEGEYDDPTRWMGPVQGSYNNDITVIDDSTAECGQALRFRLNTEVGGEFSAGFRTPLPSGIPDVGGASYTISFRYRSEGMVNENLGIAIKSRDSETSEQRKDYAFRRVVPEGEYQSLTISFTSDATDDANDITIQFFNGDDSAAIILDDVEVDYTLPEPEPEDCNEGDLNTLSAWTIASTITTAAEVTDSAAVCDNAFELVPQAVQPEWYNAVIRPRIENAPDDEVGERYRVSFKYRATADARLAVLISSNNRADQSKIEEYEFNFLDATTAYRSFATTLTSVATDSALAYLDVVIGLGLTDETVYIDDVVIEKIVQTRTEPTTVYVNPTIGNDNNDGLANTPGNAWKSITHALTTLLPGDTLLLADGLYSEGPLTLKEVVSTADRPTVIKSINKWGAKLEGNFENGTILLVEGSEHVVVDGIEVFSPVTDDSLKTVGVRSQRSDYVTIQNVFAHDCGCNGISGREGDYITLQDNIVRDNAKNSFYNCSGISVYQPIQKDTLPGYHIIIRRNVAFENECRLPFTPRGFDKPTDGNGIILDDFYQTQNNGVPPFQAASLVENNLTFNNGGNGIKVYKAERVTVRNNTAWHNNYVLSEGGSFWGEITLQSVYEQTDVVNNVMVQQFGQPGHGFTSFNVEESMTLAYQNNLVVGSTRIDDPNVSAEVCNKVVSIDRQSFPEFGQATTEVTFDDIDDFKAYFGLRATSPGIDAGSSENAPDIGLNGTERPQGSGVDIGAYEGAVNGTGPLPKDELLVATIPSVAVPIEVDGEKEGFYTGLTQTPSRVLVNELDNEDDLAATWTAGWDEDNLYVYVAVEDDVTGSSHADAVSLFIDANNAKGETYDADDRQFTLSYDGTTSANFTASVLDTEVGYQAEMAIPWSLIGITPADSTRIGLDLIIDDDDNADGTVDHQLSWQAGREGAETNPSLFGEGLLIEVAPPPFIAATTEAVAVDGMAESNWDNVDVFAIANELKAGITSEADLSGQWRAQWDQDNLYFFVSVNDDDKQNDSDRWFNDDGVEIYIDADNSRDGDYGSNDYQIVIEYNGEDVYDTKGNLGEGATAQVVDTDTGYDVEVALPWTALKVTPESGSFLGLDVHLIDDDEGGNSDSKLAWFARVDDSYRNTTLFGTAVLAPPPADEGLVLPGQIEAEAFTESKGKVVMLPSEDTDGTDAILFQRKHASAAYLVEVAQAGTYTFTYRVRATTRKKSSFLLQLDGKTLHKVKVRNKKKQSSDWQEVTASADLLAGEQELKLVAKKPGGSVNWWRAELTASTYAQVAEQEEKPVLEAADSPFLAYPNPTRGTLHLKLPTSEPAVIDVYDFFGQRVRSYQSDTVRQTGISLQGLPEGLYMIRAKAEGKSFQQRIILKR